VARLARPIGSSDPRRAGGVLSHGAPRLIVGFPVPNKKRYLVQRRRPVFRARVRASASDCARRAYYGPSKRGVWPAARQMGPPPTPPPPHTPHPRAGRQRGNFRPRCSWPVRPWPVARGGRSSKRQRAYVPRHPQLSSRNRIVASPQDIAKRRHPLKASGRRLHALRRLDLTAKRESTSAPPDYGGGDARRACADRGARTSR